MLYPLGSRNAAVFVDNLGSWRRCSVTEDPWAKCRILENLCFQCIQRGLFGQVPSHRFILWCSGQGTAGVSFPVSSWNEHSGGVVLPVLRGDIWSERLQSLCPGSTWLCPSLQLTILWGALAQACRGTHLSKEAAVSPRDRSVGTGCPSLSSLGNMDEADISQWWQFPSAVGLLPAAHQQYAYLQLAGDVSCHVDGKTC